MGKLPDHQGGKKQNKTIRPRPFHFKHFSNYNFSSGVNTTRDLPLKYDTFNKKSRLPYLPPPPAPGRSAILTTNLAIWKRQPGRETHRSFRVSLRYQTRRASERRRERVATLLSVTEQVLYLKHRLTALCKTGQRHPRVK